MIFRQKAILFNFTNTISNLIILCHFHYHSFILGNPGVTKKSMRYNQTRFYNVVPNSRWYKFIFITSEVAEITNCIYGYCDTCVLFDVFILSKCISYFEDGLNLIFRYFRLKVWIQPQLIIIIIFIQRRMWISVFGCYTIPMKELFIDRIRIVSICNKYNLLLSVVHYYSLVMVFNSLLSYAQHFAHH